MPKLNIEELFVARPAGTNGEFAQELRRALNDMLEMAECLFGQRDCSFTILGIKFRDDGPGIEYWRRYADRKINIILSTSAGQDMLQACYQLAHETVHLLAPIVIEDTTYFEEGVACYFAAYYMNEAFKRPNCRPAPGSKNYEKYICALELVKMLLDKDKHCVSKLRDVEPSFSKMDEGLIRNAFPDWTDLSQEHIEDLTKLFYEDTGT